MNDADEAEWRPMADLADGHDDEVIILTGQCCEACDHPITRSTKLVRGSMRRADRTKHRLGWIPLPALTPAAVPDVTVTMPLDIARDALAALYYEESTVGGGQDWRAYNAVKKAVDAVLYPWRVSDE